MDHEGLRAVFLSASVPDPRRHQRYFGAADIIGIREAVLALVQVVLPRARLVFGGHPAISPLVVLAADRVELRGQVRIFQSEWFREVVPPENLAFPCIKWTPVISGDLNQSLQAMRESMLASESFAAGVFIGGMEGVEEEFALFRQRHPIVPAYAIASTGAAALELWRAHPQRDVKLQEHLKEELVYDALFRALLGVGQ
jgi:hypothetical protein